MIPLNAVRKTMGLALLAVLSACSLTSKDSSCPGRRTPQPVPPVSTGELVGELVNLDALACMDGPEYKTFMFSSYDRNSTAPYTAGWFNNSDGFGNEPIPAFLETIRPAGKDGVGEYLMAQVDGPGAIVRTWTTNPGEMGGRLVVTLDGRPEPLFDGPAHEFLRFREFYYDSRTGRKHTEGFTQRDACFFPVPFARSLRMTWTGRLSDLHFYQVQVRQYAPGTAVQTFERADLVTWQKKIDAVGALLGSRGEQMTYTGPAQEVQATVGPEQSVDLYSVQQTGAIRELTVRVEAEDLTRALREIVLEGFFDGAQMPQIEAPLGAFFTSVPGVVPFESLPMQVLADGTMTCRFVMPFGKSAVLRLKNFGTQPAHVSGRVGLNGWVWKPGRDMHFHAKWAVERDLLAGGGELSQELPFLVARGRGKLVGAAALLLNPTGVVTGPGSWWGEGDEKIWVDQDTSPSFMGTGSEDYFNYSWGVRDLFQHAYFGQTISSGAGSGGHVVDQRWHIIDAIPFRQHIDFYMELIHHSTTPGLSYARMVYFYATASTKDVHVRLRASQVLADPKMPTGWLPRGVGGDEERAVFIQAEDVLAAGAHGCELIEDGLWAGRGLVAWTPAQAGQRLDFTVNLEEGGTYKVLTQAALCPQGGRAEIQIDGQPQGDLDFYQPNFTLSRERWTVQLPLEAGVHTLSLVAGLPEAQSQGNRIGVDFFWFIPVKP